MYGFCCAIDFERATFQSIRSFWYFKLQ